MRCSVILPAAGRGSRFRAGQASAAATPSLSKVEHALEGRAVFLRAIDLFRERPEVTQILLAVDPDRLDDFAFRWSEALSFRAVDLVPGGRAERWETVAAALTHVEAEATHIAVHDAARPATPAAVLDRVFAAATQHHAVVPGLPVADTLKRLADPVTQPADGNRDALDRIDDILGLNPTAEQSASAADLLPENPSSLGFVESTVSRERLIGVQTPQVFRADVLRDAYADVVAEPDRMSGITDDASLLERGGVAVHVVPGDPGNLKLTRPEDRELLSALLRFREAETRAAEAVRDLFGNEDEDE
jgi:2-C-methyl-D-erythritol 4-phosphate cytidylyltransferase